ncbi:MAG: HAMP domain-containing histidine kinase [Betaproteobacteria bacterium]|nr:HAMP domain-containing histidine kinase [Betaproteobacteria bacterium]
MLKRLMRRQTLARRIVLAFTMMAVVVGSALSLGIVRSVHYAEKTILSRAFKETVARVAEDLRQGREPYLNEGMRIFIQDYSDHDIPLAFRNARQGFSEMKDEGRDYWVYTRHDRESGKLYLIVQDQHDFEVREQILGVILWVSLLATILGAFILGRLMARRVMSPVTRLSQQVRDFSISRPIMPLAKDYADDEVGQLARAFDEAFARLGFAIEKERLFTSDVSHELRTPLMVIATSCELLLTTDLSAQTREQVRRIARAAEEMRGLSETFLALARAESGKAIEHVDTDGVTLKTLAEAESKQWAAAAAAKGLAFELREEGEDKGRYHAILLRSVMDNLLRNALYYTERGWIRLTLAEGEFRVEDNGIGIPDSEKEEIFQSFTRGVRACGEGQGLGLSLVQRIAAQQGWQVSLESLPHGGSRFTVRLKNEGMLGE